MKEKGMNIRNPEMAVLVLTVLLSAPMESSGQRSDGTDSGFPVLPMVGFTDTDGDGVNDRYCDADGDGVNDRDGKRYRRMFRYEDADGDGLNDHWRDANGDGVNDLVIPDPEEAWTDSDGDGIADDDGPVLSGKALRGHVLDADGDGRNDVTGEIISKMRVGSWTGSRKTGSDMDRFIDTDGDGMADDRSGGGVQRKWRRQGKGGR